jgi:hypothetical protein
VLHRHPQAPGEFLAARPETGLDTAVFQDVPGEAGVFRVGRRHPGHHAVAARDYRYQALRLQAAHGIADGAPADPEFGCQIRLDQPGFRGQFIVQDPAPESLAHRLWERDVLKRFRHRALPYRALRPSL